MPPSASKGTKGYPSTPHLPFSPGVQAEDITLDDCPWLVGREVVVTEKLDGGNCCLWRGSVYARTHSHEATLPWFASIKALYPSFAASVDDDLMLFGENMSAVHSVEYDGLGAHFYLFGVRRASSGEWFAWDEVAALAHALDLPHAPVWWRGTLTDLTQLKTLLRRAAARPKCPWPTARRPCGRLEAHPFARSLALARGCPLGPRGGRALRRLSQTSAAESTRMGCSMACALACALATHCNSRCHCCQII